MEPDVKNDVDDPLLNNWCWVHQENLNHLTVFHVVVQPAMTSIRLPKPKPCILKGKSPQMSICLQKSYPSKMGTVIEWPLFKGAKFFSWKIKSPQHLPFRSPGPSNIATLGCFKNRGWWGEVVAPRLSAGHHGGFTTTDPDPRGSCCPLLLKVKD